LFTLLLFPWKGGTECIVEPRNSLPKIYYIENFAAELKQCIVCSPCVLEALMSL
jgi:hypothetical protein